jgi:hypothetical protein
MLRILFLTLALAAGTGGLAQGTSGTVSAVPAGKVELTDGDVRFFDANKAMRRPAAGESVFEGDSIVTGAGGEVHLEMADGGYVAVRPNTRMRITQFRAEGGPDDRALFGLLEGSFRSVTGWIAKVSPRSYVVRSPTATIGVRGTEHEPHVIAEGSALGEAGTYDRVYAGETVITTPRGTVAVRPNQAGFAPHRATAPPRVLERIPAHYKPGKFDKRLENLHARTRATLDAKRDARRKLVEEKKKAGTQERKEVRDRVEHKREQAEDKRKQLREEREHRKAEREKHLEERRQHAEKQRSHDKGAAHEKGEGKRGHRQE